MTRRSNRKLVYETLRRRVLTLELPPGSALSENELAASLGCSRTPVRESLILLSEEGLVQVFPQIGSFVSRVDPDRVADAQFLREAVELAALDDLPAVLDEDVVEQLRANLERQQHRGLDRETFFELDEAFHQDLLRLSGHGRTWSTVQSAKGHLDRARRMGLHAATGAAAVLIGMAAGLFRRGGGVPPLIITLAGITPLLPGLTVYRGFYQLAVQGVAGLETIMLALTIGVALAAGVALGDYLTRPRRITGTAVDVTGATSPT